MSVFMDTFKMCVTEILPVFSVQSILLFCVYMSVCTGLVVPNITL